MENKENSFSALQFAWSLGYTIALPLIVLALVGRLIDKKFATHPWFLLVGILLSIMISSLAVWFKVAKIINDTEKK